jgi:6-phosphogluconolactonase
LRIIIASLSVKTETKILPIIMTHKIYFILFLAITVACNNPKDSMKDETTEPLVFVGTYTDKEGHVDGQADGIYALAFDSKEGSLKETSFKVKTTNPSYISIDSENKRIYAANEKVGQGEQISAFSIGDSSISLLNSVPSYGGAPCHLIDSDGYIFTANYVGGNHVIFKIEKDGSIGDSIQVIQNIGKGATSRQEAAHAHMITQNPHTGDYLTADLGIDQIGFYSLDQSTGTLAEKMTLNLEPGSGPRHMDFSIDQNIIYILNELSGSIAVAKPKGETYEVVQTIVSTKMGDPSLAGCAAIHIHPSGKFLYASNRGPYNSIAQYSIGEDGLLEMVGEISSGGNAPRDFAIDPSGAYILAANQNSDNIVVLKINQETGQLSETGTNFSAPTPVCLKFL